MGQIRVPELDRLYEEVSEYRSSRQYQELLEFIKRFPAMAPYNAMLIHMQYPGCQYAATPSEWRRRFGRRVKPNARPLVVLKPFGPVSFVFDINDTTGPPVPERALNPLKAKGDVPQAQYDDLVSRMAYEGVGYSTMDHGAGSGGQIRYALGVLKVRRLTSGTPIDVKMIYQIFVNKNQTSTTNYATLLHELGHMYCGHLPHPRAKWLPKRRQLLPDETEFEAESVSWLVCERLGIVNPSEGYLSGYLDSNGMIPKVSMEAILKAASSIERLIGREIIEPRKELIIKEKEG